MNGLSGINIELTSRCNKSCHMCGRRKIEKDYPEIAQSWGDMPLDMLRIISDQIPRGVFVQLHNNGEPLVYPHFEDALRVFMRHHTGLNTNGKLLMAKADVICAHLSTITVSVIPDDPDGEEQLEIAREFLKLKTRPRVVFRLLGEIDLGRRVEIVQMQAQYGNVIICHRILHSPDGSHDYEKPVTIPEIGVCLEMMHKLAIDRFGNVYPCVRFDPDRKNLLGNISTHSLESIWYGPIRKQWVRHHIEGRRDRVPLCSECHFWGVPRG